MLVSVRPEVSKGEWWLNLSCRTASEQSFESERECTKCSVPCVSAALKRPILTSASPFFLNGTFRCPVALILLFPLIKNRKKEQ